jgi:hypothetical protein
MPLLRSAHEPGQYWLASYVSGQAEPESNFAEAAEYSVQIEGVSVRILRKQEPWWTFEAESIPTGNSSPARIAEISRWV